MALTDAFLNTCRTAIASLAELTAFRTAYATFSSSSRASRLGYWHAVYTPGGTDATSPAHTLRVAIRGVINAQADIAGTLSPLDREQAYRTLNAEYVTVVERPPTDAEEQAAFQTLFFQDLLS